MSVHPLRPDTRRRLGRPLPCQPADRPQTVPPAQHTLLSSHAFTPWDLIRYYPVFLPAIPVTRVRHPRVTHQSATLGYPKVSCRSTCMLKTRRQRSFWARIKLSVIILICPKASDILFTENFWSCFALIVFIDFALRPILTLFLSFQNLCIAFILVITYHSLQRCTNLAILFLSFPLLSKNCLRSALLRRGNQDITLSLHFLSIHLSSFFSLFS